MQIIPVLDLMKGLVVHGVKGEREQYQPVKSLLTASANPLEIANALHMETECHSLYIADLDAIQGTGTNKTVIKEIASQLDIKLWVDAGTADLESVIQLFETGADVVIIGSETLTSLQQLRSIYDLIPREKILFSLDISKDLVLSRSTTLQGITPLKALRILTRETGGNRFILLTLDAVGTANGPDVSLLENAKCEFPSATFIAGGGVKTAADLNALSGVGANGVLVATSLHNGWITGQDLSSFR